MSERSPSTTATASGVRSTCASNPAGCVRAPGVPEVPARGRRVGERLGQPLGMAGHAGEVLQEPAVRRAPVERVRVVPALDERAQHLPDDRPAQLEGRVVPRRPVSVAAVDRRLLGVAAVVGVVPAAVAQVPLQPPPTQFVTQFEPPRQVASQPPC